MDDDEEIERLLRGLELPDVEDDGARWEDPAWLDEGAGWTTPNRRAPNYDEEADW